jgi:glucokinase
VSQAAGMLAVGVDVGGSKASIGLIDVARGAVLQRVQVRTPPLEETGALFLAEIAGAVRFLLARAGKAEPLPVGIGICEIVETSGEIVSAHRVRWTSSEVHRAFSFARRVVIEADVRAAAVAEARFGAGQGLAHWIYANAGTGVATVLMEGETPYPGAHGRAVAAGMSHAAFALTHDTPRIEEIVGGAGMLARALEAGIVVDHVAGLLDGATAGDAASRAIVVEGGFVFGRMLGLLANALDPQAVVIGGGIAAASPDFVEACRAAFRDSVWYDGAGIPAMPLAQLGADSGLIGAAVCACRVG